MGLKNQYNWLSEILLIIESSNSDSFLTKLFSNYENFIIVSKKTAMNIEKTTFLLVTQDHL